MTIIIRALHQEYWYPKLLHKPVKLLKKAPHTDTEWAFWKFESDNGDVAWAYVHKHLCEIQ